MRRYQNFFQPKKRLRTGESVIRVEASLEWTAKGVFGELQVRHPGRIPDTRLRTLQRRVEE